MKVLPISVLNKKVSGSVLPPDEGALIITSGQTVTLTAPITKSYTSIDVQAGGTLNITGSGNLAEIYCSGTFNVDGTILCRATERNGYSYVGTTFSGFNYGHIATQRNGGSGGKGGQPAGGLGGAGTNGYGGGGGGGSDGLMAGGNGGSNNGSGFPGAWRHGTYGSPNVTGIGNPYAGIGGAGNATNSDGSIGGAGNIGQATQDGGSGGGSGGGGGSHNFIPGNPADKITIDVLIQGGGGGGGGHKGLHGGILYLYSVLPITGSGSVIASGTNGFVGGGGNRGTGSDQSGGGGGGGAGGSGGNIIIQAPSYSFSTSISGGSGGSGGGVITSGGSNGGAGASGNNGIVQVV